MAKKILVVLIAFMVFNYTNLNFSASELSEYDELAIELDKEPNQQNFIQVSADVANELKGKSVKLIESSVDLNVFNPTIRGPWGVYKVDGQYVFCITPGQDTLSVATPITKGVFNKFSKTTQEYISQVISISMQNYKDSSNTDWLFGAQLIIWDYVSAHEADVIGNPFGSGKPNFLTSWRIHTNSIYLSEIHQIETEMKQWKTIPSFTSNATSGKTIELKFSGGIYQAELTDTNHVWDSKYAKYGNFGQYKLTNPPGKDNLLISTNTENSSGEVIKFQWTPYLSGYKQLYDGGQDLILVGADPNQAYINLRTEVVDKGGLVLRKTGDEDQLLAGCEFGLFYDANGNDKYDENDIKVRTIITNSDGVATTEDIPVGNYYLIETKAPTGYQLNDQALPLEITKNEINDEYYNNPINNLIIKGGFKLTKVGENENSNPSPLSGVEFTLTSPTYPTFEKVYTTNEDGMVVTNGSELKYGDYHIEETKAPSKYVQGYSEDFSITTNGEIVSLNKGKEIVNSLFRERVKLTKLGQSLLMNNGDYTALSQAEFTIYQEIGDVNGVVDKQDKAIETIITNQEGVAQSSLLPEGNYILVETKAPPGYQLNSQIVSFAIENDGVSNGATIDLGKIIDTPIVGKAQLLKVSSLNCDRESDRPYTLKECQAPLANVGFSVYQDYNGNQIIDKGEDNPIDYFETNEQGIGTTSNLKYGNYIIVETKALDGYYPNNEVYPFVINSSDLVDINQGIAIENIPKVGSINIHKYGETLDNLSSNKQSLEAEFTIFNDEGQEVETITTTNGEANSAPLIFGDYYLQETKAPPGYLIDDTKYPFTIDEDTYKTELQYYIEDQPIVGAIAVNKVDEQTKEMIAGAELEIIDTNNQVIDKWETTNQSHNLTLKFGQYQLCETKAPGGYQKAKTCAKITIDEPIDQTINFTNKKISLEITGGNWLAFRLAIIAIFITIVLLYLRLINKQY